MNSKIPLSVNMRFTFYVLHCVKAIIVNAAKVMYVLLRWDIGH
jgi:hypothetical protein